jgi:hypothetical protein
MAFSTSTAKWLVGVSFATVVLVVIMALISDHPHLPAVQQCSEESAQCIDACFSVNVSSVINNGTGENPMTDSDVMESEDESSSLPTCTEKCPGSDDCFLSVDELIGNDTTVREYVSETEKYITEDGHFDSEKAREDHASSEVINAGEYYNYISTNNTNEVGIQWKFYGNWCGPSYGSGKPIDVLDLMCKFHDQCYDKTRTRKGYCSCDRIFVREVMRNQSKMFGEAQKTAAARAVVAFVAKIAVLC